MFGRLPSPLSFGEIPAVRFLEGCGTISGRWKGRGIDARGGASDDTPVRGARARTRLSRRGFARLQVMRFVGEVGFRRESLPSSCAVGPPFSAPTAPSQRTGVGRSEEFGGFESACSSSLDDQVRSGVEGGVGFWSGLSSLGRGR